MINIIQKHKWDENGEWHEELFFTKKRDGIELKNLFMKRP
jgi:hypothetical protein